MIYTISKIKVFKYFSAIIAIIGILLFTKVSANPATIDPGFDTKVPVGFNYDVYTIVNQSDGKIVVGGSFTTYQ
jgi:hypothetical protein